MSHYARERRSVKHPEPSPFPAFCEALRKLIDETAAAKGYHRTGLAGPNPLYTFVSETVGGPGHALGEMIFKIRRYAARRDPEDLLKIAAWAYLVWCFDHPDERQQQPGASKGDNA